MSSLLNKYKDAIPYDTIKRIQDNFNQFGIELYEQNWEDMSDDTCGLKIPVVEYPDKVEIDTDLLSEKIVYLLEHPVEAKQLGENARERYLKYYSSEIFRKNMFEFYQSLYE
jgi:glycosyltransferase involved in cell wall biosynthesis